MSIFERVVCGVDPTPAGEVAARQAALLARPDGLLVLATIEDPTIAARAGWGSTHVVAQLQADAEAALEHARVEVAPLHDVEAEVLAGEPSQTLLAEVARRHADLVVVGSHAHSRAAGIAVGSVSTFVLHEAPCSVLVARRESNPVRWPHLIVVGVDGSPESARATAVARALCKRVGGQLRIIGSTEGGHLDLGPARHFAPELEEHMAPPVDALAVASEHADLIVIGSRGLRGIRALGSVSEQIGHEARCSVLVVRGPRE